MKRSFAALLAVFATVSAHAGSFGGPTSLSTSTNTTAEGTYQATARGTTISGIIRFAYDADGNQSATTNTVVFFVDGIIATGTADVAIMGKKIAGIITSNTTSTENPTVEQINVTGGSFSATIKSNSANYAFKGNGNLQTYVAPITDPATLNFEQIWRTYKVVGQRTSTSS
jgi:hypothetical protein